MKSTEDRVKDMEDLRTKYDCTEYKEKAVHIPPKPKEGLVLVVGTSGSGKSTILRSWFGKCKATGYPKAGSVLDAFSTVAEGVKMLNAFGLRTVPVWFRARETLSNGEGHRADCALAIHRGLQYIDEFTSVVDRDTAKALSVSLRKWHTSGLLVLACCHEDVEDWLQPDIVYDCDICEFRPRRLDRRPKITLDVRNSTVKDWVYFSKHHYLTGDISKSCHCYTAFLNEKPVAFYAVIHACNRDIHSFWRGSRLVVLPEFQGMGIGVALADAVASEYVRRGLRFFAKTANIPIGEYRNRSTSWRATSTNMKARPSYLKNGVPREQKGFGKSEEALLRDSMRVCYSHELMTPVKSRPTKEKISEQR